MIPNSLKLIRGLPGSGKSTYATSQFKDYVHLEADMWHGAMGKYTFESSEVENSHRWCVGSCEFAIRSGHNVVVSNTFITIPEIAPYFVIADKYGCSIEVISMKSQYARIHDVPGEVLETMKANFVSDEDILKYLQH